MAEVRGVAAHDLEPVGNAERLGSPARLGRQVLGQLHAHGPHRRKCLEHREHPAREPAAQLEQDASGREHGDIGIRAELRSERLDECGRERVGGDRPGEDQPLLG